MESAREFGDRSIRLTRKTRFSAGHRFWSDALSPEQNRARFGEWASPHYHGHNYTLEATIAGGVDPRTAMIVNIRELDAVLKERIVRPLDRRCLNEEVPHFRDRAPSLEEFVPWIRDQLCDASGGLPGLPAARLVKLVLEEEPGFRAAMEREGDNWMLTLTRSYDFSSGHRLYSESLSPEENLDLYGKDTNPAGHGHNFDLEVTVSGDPDAKTGMMVDIGKLDEAVKRLVIDRYDHKNLNVDVPELEGKVPTLEVVILEIWRLLEGAVPGRLERIRLQENARNHCEVARR